MDSRHLKIVFLSQESTRISQPFLLLLVYPCLLLRHLVIILHRGERKTYVTGDQAQWTIHVPFCSAPIFIERDVWVQGRYLQGIYIVLLKKKKERLTCCTWPTCPTTTFLHSEIFELFSETC